MENQQNTNKSLWLDKLSGPHKKIVEDTIAQVCWAAEIPAPSRPLSSRHPIVPLSGLPRTPMVGCQGVQGAYSHIAANRLFPEGSLCFYEEFADVAAALENGEIQFGVLPVENSAAGQVAQVLSLISQKKLSIAASIDIKVEHCLCAHTGTSPALISQVLSHPQALSQCAVYLAEKKLVPVRFSNTAAAAEEIGKAPTPRACICSALSAKIYGLRVLAEKINDYNENYTRFACLSTENLLLPGADTIAIALSLPHEPGALGRLLTRFSACQLDLTRLTSMPIASRDFRVVFHLDFRGSILTPSVAALLGAMYDEFEDFQFLGNFSRQ